MELGLPRDHQQLHQEHHAGEFPSVRKIPRLCVQFHRVETLSYDEGVLSRAMYYKSLNIVLSEPFGTFCVLNFHLSRSLKR